MLIEGEFTIVASIERGLKDVAANRLVAHEQVTADARAILADAKLDRGMRRADWPD